MPARALTAALAVALVLAVVSPRAQQTARPVFQSSVQLVRVDAVVVDADGNPVHGLVAPDFELDDRGKPQTIAAFQEIRHEPATSLPLGHHDVASNVVDDASQLMIIVLDDFHIRKEWTEPAREVARDFVTSLDDGVMMALLTTTGRYNVELTTDRARILDAIDRFAGGEYPVAYIAPGGQGPALQSAPGLSAQEAAMLHVDQSMPRQPRDSDWGGIIQSRNGTLVGVLHDSESLYKLLENAARMLGSEDSRHKGFAWISTGLPQGMAGFQPAVDAMREAGIATYAIDPTGTNHVIAGGAYDGVKRVGIPTPWDVSADSRHTSLVTTSRATGGIAVVGDDNLKGGVNRIVQDFDDYYVLGFSPDDVSTPGARLLQVKVNKPGLTVRARLSYSMAAAASRKPVDSVASVLNGLVPKSDLPLRLYATALPPAAGSPNLARVLVAMEVTAPTSVMRTSGRLEDALKYDVFAVSLRNGHVSQSVTNNANLTLTPTGRTMPSVVTYTVETMLALAPGQYQLRASAHSQRVGKTGSVYLPIDIPDFRHARLALTDVVLGESRVPVTSDSRRSAQLAHAVPFAPTLSRTFARVGDLRIYAEVAATSRTPIAAGVALVQADGREAWAAQRTLAPADRGRLDVTMPLAGLAPGPYALRVTASDGTSRVQREIAVQIR